MCHYCDVQWQTDLSWRGVSNQQGHCKFKQILRSCHCPQRTIPTGQVCKDCLNFRMAFPKADNAENVYSAYLNCHFGF